ncbi:hypothetical protein [Sporolactobacillus sp. KGMB 08714]|uniref:hypothetical protein n=1 Tax=Sporolactobacillus sp. KGMB 08714 TaxID=3064704 RepID=UPI002FBECDE0
MQGTLLIREALSGNGSAWGEDLRWQDLRGFAGIFSPSAKTDRKMHHHVKNLINLSPARTDDKYQLARGFFIYVSLPQLIIEILAQKFRIGADLKPVSAYLIDNFRSFPAVKCCEQIDD